jgi:KUP system potassium uptake protein
MGQIYLPGINRMLFLGVVALVLDSGRRRRSPAPYGIAVTGTMAITTVLAFVVARTIWRWNLLLCVALFGAFPARRPGLFQREHREDRRRRLFPLA